jgi:hypothetical protein
MTELGFEPKTPGFERAKTKFQRIFQLVFIISETAYEEAEIILLK